jgi:membrane-bound lytic murein transglycosylase F
MNSKLRMGCYLVVVALLLPALGGCEQRDSLDRIRDDGRLVVVSRNSPTTYFLDRQEPTGFEYALTKLLAEDLGVKLRLEPAFDLLEIFERLSREEADIAAAGLTLTPKRAARYPHSDSYQQLTPQVVYVAGTFRPRDLADLEGMSIVILAGSSHADTLEELQAGAYPQLSWREVRAADTMELLELLDDGEAQLAIIDSNEFAVQQSLYPRIKVAFDLAAEQDMVWYLAPGADNARLIAYINAFIERLSANGTLERLREIHFGHAEGRDRIASHTFMLKMQRSLPPYRRLIEQVAREFKMEWQLLAAIAYQESHWNPQAASPTGVRGMMMLTLPTARELGVTNRLDPVQSLRGGARYYKNMKRRLPGDIFEPDRTWLALAAYNIGMGHLEDARKLTERHGGDPHLWEDVMDNLPLLQKSKYYKSVRYGYARGMEAVTYVQNIRHYYNILSWQEIPGQQAEPPERMQDYLPPAIGAVKLWAL